jgi:hypothetical protein
MSSQVQKWLRDAVGFRHTGKAMGQVINVGGGYVEKCMFILGLNIMFYILYPFVTYLLNLPHNNNMVDVQP